MVEGLGFCLGPLSPRSLGLRVGRNYPIEFTLNTLCTVALPEGFRASRAVVEERSRVEG